MDIEAARYDGSAAATATGRSGLVEGEKAVIRLGQALIVGRSRSCGLSVARSAACLRLGREALEQHPSYRKISRRHIRIALLSRDLLEIEDLSTNGTVVDGFRVDKRILTDFSQRVEGVMVEFGEGERLLILPAASGIEDDEELLTNASGSHRRSE